MKNIKSNKREGGFIGALLGLIVIGFILYITFVTLLFGGMFIWAGAENEKAAEERAQYTDLEWIQKEGYATAQRRYCSKDPNRQYDTFSCTDTIEEWVQTPSAKKVILKGLHIKAKGEWMTENRYYAIQKDGFEVMRYRSMSKFPCTYTYLNKTYKCESL
tara:strand:+ start:477 stop:956 length:480 start_codon:yes stop_codon:yes gene_type:complete